jgi:hypothetical protein
VAGVLTTSWLSTRLGIDPFRLQAMRRRGELVAYRPEGSQEYLFPAWQFDAELRPRAIVARLTALARERHLSAARLLEVLDARVGIGGEERLHDLIRAGEDDRVLETVRDATP